ncbi:MAG: YjbQ family protein [Deltaproteobacteria bacterium]|nr:YjbQ family protein [Deltaproteobacteria bacterium]
MSEVQTIDIRTTTRLEMVDITALVRAAVKRTGATHGLATVFCPHTTAGLTIQENADPDVKSDLLAHLARLVPKEAGFRHGEGNSDAHIKSSIIGASTTLLVDSGKLLLGHWQAIFFCEFDGPRDRRVFVKVVKG